MAVVTLMIDDQPVSAHANETILDAAREAGVRIPTLCQLDGVTAAGACRMCLVEVQGMPRLQAACVTRVVENMVVHTATEKLREYRKMILELLYAEGNHVCAVCVANRRCELQDLAARHGMDHVRFEYQFPDRAVDASHPRFGIDHNRCILCTRCVRTCDELEGAHTWDIAGRGRKSRVITDMAQPWGEASSCTSCGKCLNACPTGAIFPQGATVAEAERDKARLAFLATAREKKQWGG